MDDIRDAMKALGPKRVKTKDYEIEAHDPEKVEKVLRRSNSRAPLLANFGITLVKPKEHGCICKTDQQSGGCE